MPVINLGGEPYLSKNKTSQQVSAPINKDNKEITVDNDLQLDQKIRTVLGISQNICEEFSKINKKGKNLLLTNQPFKVDNLINVEETTPVIFQGSNYPIVSPTEDSFVIDNYPTATIFENIEFFTSNKEPIIKLQNNSKVLFKNCVFRKTNSTQTSSDSFIYLEANCRASFVGCWFIGTQTAGSVINNAGLANNVSVNGGFNTTTRTHNNTTIFGEIT